MKLQHIRQSLDDIKSDDLIIIEELKNKINDLEKKLDKKYIELDDIEMRKEIINNILDIKGNKKRFLRILRPVLEFVLMLLASFLTIISIESLSTILVLLLCFIMGLSLDAFNIIQKDYTKITDKDEPSYKIILRALYNVFMKTAILSLNMDECIKAESQINSEIKELETEMSANRSLRDNLKDEVSYIEGNAHAVNCLINKYKFEEMGNDNALVQFIEAKKELKKTAHPLSSY